MRTRSWAPALFIILVPLFCAAPGFSGDSRLNQLHRQKAAVETELAEAKADRDKAAAMVKSAQEKGYLETQRVANEARLAAEQRIDIANEKLRAINGQIESTPKQSGGAPRDLATNQDLAAVMNQRLKLVRGRIDRLQKSKSNLSYKDNPQWEKHWEALMSDFRRDNQALTEVSLDGLTSILMMGYQASLAKNAAKPAPFSSAERQKLGAAAKRFEKIVAQENVFGAASQKMKDLAGTLSSPTLDALNTRAVIWGQARDLAFALGSAAERRTDNLDQTASTALIWEAVQSLGDVTVIFVQHSPLVSEVKDRAGLIAKMAEADALQFMTFQDQARLQAAADQSAERQKKLLAIDAILAQLQEEERVLTDEIKRAGGKVEPHP